MIIIAEKSKTSSSKSNADSLLKSIGDFTKKTLKTLEKSGTAAKKVLDATKKTSESLNAVVKNVEKSTNAIAANATVIEKNIGSSGSKVKGESQNVIDNLASKNNDKKKDGVAPIPDPAVLTAASTLKLQRHCPALVAVSLTAHGMALEL